MNLFQISQQLQNVINVIEENGGEVNDEIMAELELNQENLKEKLADYYKAIKAQENEVASCKEEKKRINALQKSKEKTIDRLKSTIVSAIQRFGFQDKNGVQRINCENLTLSTRKSTSIVVDTERVNLFIGYYLEYLKEIEDIILNEANTFDDQSILDGVNIMYQHFSSAEDYIPFTIEEYKAIVINMSININIKDLIKYPFLIKSYLSLNFTINDATTKEEHGHAIDNAEANNSQYSFARREMNYNLAVR